MWGTATSTQHRAMTHIHLIGIGTGNPDHLTRAAEEAVKAADLILIPHKGADKADLADMRQAILDGIRPDAPTALFEMPKRASHIPYLHAVEAWHTDIAQIWADTIAAHNHPHHVALLVWGDPSLYDSTLRIAARLTPRPQITVIPGLTSLQMLTAAHAIPLNTLGAPVTITTGRRLRDYGWPSDTDTLAVMLDGACAFQTLAPEDFDIWWGAYLGMANEMLLSGSLLETGAEIITERAAARAAHGWIMDIYLLRKRTSEKPPISVGEAG